MAKKTINLGSGELTGDGESIRSAFSKVNENFDDLYTTLGLDSDDTLNLGAFEFNGSVMSTTDSTPIVIDQATTVTSDLTVGGNLLPNVANGGDLGSSARPWKSLYISDSTIYLGETALSVDGVGNLLVDGQPIADVGTAAWDNITGKPTIPTSFDRLVNGANTVSLDANGNLTFPQGTLLGYSDPGGFIINGAVDKDIAIYTYNGADAHGWTFGTDGSLTLPGDIKSDGNINIEVNLTDSTKYIWQFGEDGALTLPGGSTIAEVGPFGVLQITPRGGANIYQALMIYPWATAEGDQIHLASGDPTTVDLYLGDNDQYVKIEKNGGDVVIGTNTNTKQWTFGTDGGLTFPDSTVQTTAWTGTVSGTISATAAAGTTSTTAAGLGYIGMPQNSTATSYTLVAGDQGKHVYVTTTGQTITVPANTATSFPVGTTIAIIAGPSATTSTIVINSDTMYLGGTGSTGNRTLAAFGMATLVKVAETTWFISGAGLT